MFVITFVPIPLLIIVITTNIVTVLMLMLIIALIVVDYCSSYHGLSCYCCFSVSTIVIGN